MTDTIAATIEGPSPGWLRLPRILSNGLVLQRESDVKIWGWARPGEAVTVRFLGDSFTATADEHGTWNVILSDLTVGGPYEMEIEADTRIVIGDILIGDVWVCSGQSNMQMPLERLKERYAREIASSENPLIRQFLVPEKYDFKLPHDDLDSGSWKQATPANVLHFSTVAYFFALGLFEKFRVPIGLVNASIGGASCEAWMSADALKRFPVHTAAAKKLARKGYLDRLIKRNNSSYATWHAKINRRDKGLAISSKQWFDADCDTASWQAVQLPGFWKDRGLGSFNGVVWFRKEITLPQESAGKPARLFLGRIVDLDSVYINGSFVGTTWYQYPQRVYEIPSNLLVAGKNTITVRVINSSGSGGFIEDKPYKLKISHLHIRLNGEWKYKVGAVSKPLKPAKMIISYPKGLYNCMIAPFHNYAIKGVIWYQGESNLDKAFEYKELFFSLIADWRQKWRQGNFPFIFVQLPNCEKAQDDPGESEWAEIRQAQLETLAIDNTAMVVACDLGEWNDIHPLRKKEIGQRLALAARAKVYGDSTIVASGPVYQSMEIKANKIILSFADTGSGLAANGGGKLAHFAIAGKDRRFVWADAQIENDKVVVWNDSIANPVAVRYAWADNPEGANLYNKEGFPASPFTTENLFTQHEYPQCCKMHGNRRTAQDSQRQ
jgi:sialate O-acetylesterase